MWYVRGSTKPVEDHHFKLTQLGDTVRLWRLFGRNAYGNYFMVQLAFNQFALVRHNIGNHPANMDYRLMIYSYAFIALNISPIKHRFRQLSI